MDENKIKNIKEQFKGIYKIITPPLSYFLFLSLVMAFIGGMGDGVFSGGSGL